MRKTAHSVANALLDYAGLFGLPKIVASDNGAAFTADAMSKLSDSCKFVMRFGPAYAPRVQGIVERLGGSVATLLNKWRHELHRDWESLIPAVHMVINARASHPSRMSPFETMFLRPPVDLADYSDSIPRLDPFHWNEHVQFVKAHLLPESLDHRQKALDKSNHRLNSSRATGDPLPFGSHVMMKAVRPDKGQPLWAGVFTVSGHDPSGHILVDKAGKQLDRRVPLDQLKLAGDEIANLDRIDRIVAHKSAGQLHKLPNRTEAEILSRPVYHVLFVGDDAPYPEDWYFRRSPSGGIHPLLRGHARHE